MIHPLRLALDLTVGAALLATVAGVIVFDVHQPRAQDLAGDRQADRATPDRLLAARDAANSADEKQPAAVRPSAARSEAAHNPADVVQQQPSAAPRDLPPPKAAAPSQPPAAVAAKPSFIQSAKSPVSPTPPTMVASKPAPDTTPPSTSIYAQRTAPEREAWIGKLGGSPVTEKSVRDGLAWLARHQAEDGSWSSRCIAAQPGGRCEHGDACTGPGQPYEMAQTGLALLAFQAGGHYDFNGTEYSQVVKRGLDWIVRNQRADGSLVGSQSGPDVFHVHFMYEHGIATFALGEACAIRMDLSGEPHPDYAPALVKAIEFVQQGQHHDGGWRYSPDLGEFSDTSVTGWQVLALKTAMNARVPVDAQCLKKVEGFFQKCAVGRTGQTAYTAHGDGHSMAMTGVGMLVQEFLLGRRDSPLVKAAALTLADAAEQSWGRAASPAPRARVGVRGRSFVPMRPIQQPDYYLWYNCTLGMFQAGGEPWKRWNKIVPDIITGLQEHEGCARGSWPLDHWGSQGGRIYTTSLAILTLEVYYRFANTPAGQRTTLTDPKPKPKEEDPEVVADRQFQLARQLFELGRIEPARVRLQTIIEDYPGTRGARDADALLQAMM